MPPDCLSITTNKETRQAERVKVKVQILTLTWTGYKFSSNNNDCDLLYNEPVPFVRSILAMSR